MSAAPNRAARIAELAAVAGCVHAVLGVLASLDPARQSEALDTCAGLADDLANGLADLAGSAP